MGLGECAESAMGAVIPHPSDPTPPLHADISSDWIADTGATSHMTPHRHWFREYTRYVVPIHLADGSVTHSAGVGTVQFQPVDNGVKGQEMLFSRVLHVPTLRTNLFSVLYLTRFKGFCVTISKDHMLFQRDNTCFSASVSNSNMALLNGFVVPMQQFAGLVSTCPLDATLWHRRFSHLNHADVKHMVSGKLVKGIILHSSAKPDPICEPCLSGKQHRTVNKLATSHAAGILDLTHTDLHGPNPVQTSEGFKYWITFIDDHSRYWCIALLKKKSDAFTALKNYKALMENHTGRRMKAVRDDKGGEWMSNVQKQFFAEQGIQFQHTVRAEPHQNGVAERANRTIAEHVTSMLTESHLPASFWGHGVNAYAYVHNRSPTSAVSNSVPWTLMFKKKPDVSNLRVFGCTAYVHVKKDQRKGLSSHTQKCVFIGYPAEYKAWLFYNSMTRKQIISKDAEFDERYFPGLSRKPDIHPFPSLIPSPSPPSTGSVYSSDDEDDADQVGVFHRPAAPRVGADQVGGNQPPPPPRLPPVRQPKEPWQRRKHQPAPPPLNPERYPRRDHNPPGEYWRLPTPPFPLPPLPPLPSPPPASPTSSHHPSPSPSPPPSPSPSSVPVPEHSESPPESDDLNIHSGDEGTALHAAAVAASPFLTVPEALECVFSVSVEVAAKAGTHDNYPKSFAEAMRRPDASFYYEAACKEIQALVDNGTWEVVQLPPGRKPIGTRWVFVIKHKSDGSVDRYKGRLVAKGFSQRPGFDFTETFAPTARWAALRAILVLGAFEDMEIESVDISSAFLHADADTDIYLDHPEGFPQGPKDSVLKLLKNIYGLKQGNRSWYQLLDKLLIELEFKKVRCDHSVWVYEKDGIKVIVPVYVDDLTIVSNSKAAIKSFISELKKHLKLRELGPVEHLLGVKISRDRPNRTLRLSQKQYVIDLLARYGFSDCSPISTPMDPGVRLSKDMCPKTPEEVEEMRTVPYAHAVGSLGYLAISTRPDISYAVSTLGKFNSNPGIKHWQAVKHLFRYIKGTMDYELTYSPTSSPEMFCSYSDADHGGDKDSGRSTGAYVIKMGTGAISWSSKLQTTVALSTTEAEYIAAVSGGQEILWLRNLLSELGFPPSSSSTLHIDNMSCIAVTKNPEHHGRMKHLDLKHHWLRETVVNGLISVLHCPTGDMPADILTKPLERIKVLRGAELLGLCSSGGSVT